MELGLQGRVALVTGGAQGIGAAVVAALAAEGCRVAVVDVHGSTAAHCFQADVRDFTRAAEVVAGTIESLGGLDILVCCAGITRDAISWKMTESEWDDVLAVNLKGCFNYGRAAAAVFRASGTGGRIVNVASINGLRGKAGQANYAASKAGLIGLSKTFARELGRFNVTVNVVAPGMVDTAMTRQLPPEMQQRAAEEAALGCISTPADVAAVVAFLCSARAHRITGEVIRVDAGQYI